MTTKSRRNHPAHAIHAEMSEGPVQNPAPTTQKISEEERFCTIQARAYSLWEQTGKPDGDAAREQCWCEAEQEIVVPHAG